MSPAHPMLRAVVGSVTVAVAVVVTIAVDLGFDPITLAAERAGTLAAVGDIAWWSWVVSAVMLLGAWAAGQRPGPASFTHPTIISGTVAVALTPATTFFAGVPAPMRAAAGVVACAVIGFGTALYISARRGCGPVDALPAALSRGNARWFGILLWAEMLGLVVVGATFGGKVGFITAASVLIPGPVAGWVLGRFGAGRPTAVADEPVTVGLP